MPIRLNLLAEAQAIEDARRRDPIKRVLWVAAGLIVLLLVWASSLQLRAIMANTDINRVQAAMSAKASLSKQVLENQRQLGDANVKLAALHALATNRFLYGSLLHTLQQTTIGEVQLTHLKVDQSYVLVEAIKGRTNGSKVLPGTPATSTEKITVSLDARDTSASPGDQVTKFKDALAASAAFHTQSSAANQVNLKNLSAPILRDSGRAMVNFTLEWRYPDITR
jgi:hypothetical protein